MWPLRKQINLKENGFFAGFTDWHSHILPGVDDGVRTMEESLEILRLYEESGMKSVWLTPHIMEDVPNTTAHLRERFSELQQAYTGSVELHLAAENILDNLFEKRLEQGDLLPLGERGDHLLVETSYFTPPMNLYGILERIKSKGYYPVLAHPERYLYMGDGEYRCLKDMGVKFQLNLPSIAGVYGRTVRKKAEELLNKRYYNLSGTDIHRYEMFRKLIGTDIAKGVVKQTRILWKAKEIL
jgi:tyrosine-protein phosphatase YwqE